MSTYAKILLFIICCLLATGTYQAIKVFNSPGAELGALLAMLLGTIWFIYYSVLALILFNFIRALSVTKNKLIVLSVLTVIPYIIITFG